MSEIQDKDTRYYIEINLKNLKIIKCGFDQKENLNKGQQGDPGIHKLFLTKGHYSKFVNRCSKELVAIIAT